MTSLHQEIESNISGWIHHRLVQAKTKGKLPALSFASNFTNFQEIGKEWVQISKEGKWNIILLYMIVKNSNRNICTCHISRCHAANPSATHMLYVCISLNSTIFQGRQGSISYRPALYYRIYLPAGVCVCDCVGRSQERGRGGEGEGEWKDSVYLVLNYGMVRHFADSSKGI